nr:MAG TPA: hypothetical protein [Caudoviricetes sp.]
MHLTKIYLKKGAKIPPVKLNLHFSGGFGTICL